MADRFASGLRLGYGPKIRRRPFEFHLSVDTLPSRSTRADRVFPPTFCLRFPLARVRRDFHPQEKRPAGRTSEIENLNF